MKCFSKLHVGIIAFVGISIMLLSGISTVAYAEEGKSPWLVRVRALGVTPDDESSTITLIGGNAEVDDAITLDLDITYFFTDHLAAELVLAVANHDVEAVNTVLGNVDLGDVWLLPPTLTLQYHFLPDNNIRPYVGAGINGTLFFGEDEGDVATSIDYDASFGFALQAGTDIAINDNWAINIDVKKVYLDTEVEVGALGLTLETDVDIDPWLIGVGIAYRF